MPKATRDAIVNDAEATERLLVCAEIANGSKHLVLKRRRKGASILTVKVSTNDATIGEMISEADAFGISWRQSTATLHHYYRVSEESDRGHSGAVNG